MDASIREYSKVIELDPNDVDAYNARGNSYRDQKKLQESINDYSKAIEFDPNYVNAYLGRG